MTAKKFYEPSEISVQDFKKRLAALEKKLAKFWECPNCHNINHDDAFYCEECRTRNINSYG